MNEFELLTLFTQGASFWLPALLAAAIAYFCGCFNGAVIVSKYILRDDIRTHGSGNAGLTNFFRTFGGPLTFVVILTDVLKAVIAVLVGMAIFGHFILNVPIVLMMAKYWTGIFCLLGHMFPCMFHFKGGKGILSGGAVAIMIDWRIALIVWGGFLLLSILTRYVSLGSVYAAATFSVATWLVLQDGVLTALALVFSGLILFMHRENIKRLLNGTESKFSFHHKD